MEQSHIERTYEALPELSHKADLDALRERALTKGVNPVLYWMLRAVLVPIFLVYLRMQPDRARARAAQRSAAAGRQPPQLPRPVRDRLRSCAGRSTTWPSGSCSNALAGLDPERARRLPGRPRRGRRRRDDDRAGDPRARRLRRDLPRGHAHATGRPLGEPQRGVGRLALETGAPVAPVAVIGTEDVRRGWRIRPRKVRLRVGRPLRFPLVEEPSPKLAGRRHRADLAVREPAVGVARRGKRPGGRRDPSTGIVVAC